MGTRGDKQDEDAGLGLDPGPEGTGDGGRLKRGVGAVLGGVAYWAPVVLALAFLLHVANKSLKPALVEKQRLEQRDADLRSRETEQLRRQQELETQLEALDDPIYQERVRRMESQTDAPPAKVDSPTPYSEGADG